MQCLACHYPLEQLEHQCCPECDREFNSNDATTFFVENRPVNQPLEPIGSIVLGILIYLIVLFVAFIISISGTGIGPDDAFFLFWAAPAISIGSLVTRHFPFPRSLVPMFTSVLTCIILSGMYGYLIGLQRTSKRRWCVLLIIVGFHGLCCLILWLSGVIDL